MNLVHWDQTFQCVNIEERIKNTICAAGPKVHDFPERATSSSRLACAEKTQDMLERPSLSPGLGMIWEESAMERKVWVSLHRLLPSPG